MALRGSRLLSTGIYSVSRPNEFSSSPAPSVTSPPQVAPSLFKTASQTERRVPRVCPRWSGEMVLEDGKQPREKGGGGGGCPIGWRRPVESGSHGLPLMQKQNKNPPNRDAFVGPPGHSGTTTHGERRGVAHKRTTCCRPHLHSPPSRPRIATKGKAETGKVEEEACAVENLRPPALCKSPFYAIIRFTIATRLG